MQKIAGIHLSSFNSNNTAIAILRCDGPGIYSLVSCYDKVGALGLRFADDRIVDILTCEGEIHEIFIDCPLSLPPCISCTVAACPGITRCEDLRVGMMQSMNLAVPKAKRRSVNPQAQRVWDIYQIARRNGLRHEPGFSSLNAPLAIRAMVLVKRLKSTFPHVLIRETQVEAALANFSRYLVMPDFAEYRRFSRGKEVRKSILAAFQDRQKLGFALQIPDHLRAILVESLFLFDAFIASLINACLQEGKVDQAPNFMQALDEWVFLPNQ